MVIYPPVAPPFRVSQFFGEHPSWYIPYGLLAHPGVDIPGEVGTPLHAGVAGYVYVTQTYLTGICLHMASHGGTLIYKHCQATVGVMGRQVKVGEVVATLGNTGAHTTGPHVHVEWIPADADYNNGYKGAVDPWPLIQEGIMELEKAGELATDARWQVEEIVRDRNAAEAMRTEAARLLAEADKLDRQSWERIRALVSTTRGKLYAIEAALGRPVPEDWIGLEEEP